MPILTEHISEQNLARAALFLKQGELVAFPTETVYGLGAVLFNEMAVRDIFKVKGRPSDNPLIAHIAHIEQVQQIAENIPELFYILAEHFFPGPLTVVLKRRACVPSVVSAGLQTIALRMPDHRLARNLIDLAGVPLVAPSANLSGRPSSTTAEHVLEDFNGKIAAVVQGGRCVIGIESTVVSLIDPQRPLLLRPGSISSSQLEHVLKRKVEVYSKKNDPSEAVASPGMKYRHYAPCAPLKIFMKLDELFEYCQKNPSLSRMCLARSNIFQNNPRGDFFPLNTRDLYAHLRHSDVRGYDEIVVFCDEEVQNNKALMNRLQHACH